MQVAITERVTIDRVTPVDSDGPGFFAWIMFDNHTFVKTKTGTKEEVCEDVRTVHDGDRSFFSLWTLHHESLGRDTTLVRGVAKDMGAILRPDLWGKPYNPFT